MDESNLTNTTKSIHTGQNPDKWDSKCIAPPVVLSTTFKLPEICVSPEYYSYIGYNNPNRTMVEECLASLENAKYSLCFPSGLSATTAIGFLLKSGDHILMTKDVYYGVAVVLNDCFKRFNIETTFTDMTDVEEIRANLRPNTRVSF